jgi:flagellar hook-associated protein 3 FlgL
MRVTFALAYQQMTYHIDRKRQDIDRLSTMAASGRRLTEPADDPVNWAQAMDIKQGLREMEQFGRNIDFAVGWNQTTETALNAISDALVRARNAAIEAVSPNGTQDRSALAQTIEQTEQQLFQLANTQYGDQYLFSGTTTDTTPFQEGDYTYYGDTGDIEVRLGRNTRLTVNLNGESVLFLDPTDPNSNLMSILNDLRNAIETDDTARIQSHLDNLNTAFERVTSQGTLVGARLAAVEQRQNALADLRINEQERLAQSEDADMVEVFSELQLKSTALEAALRVTAIIDKLNLTQFV